MKKSPFKPGDPRTPPEHTKRSVLAIKALDDGVANDAQQKEAMAWILNLCGIRDLSYRDNDRDTCFAEGKRFVGLQIAKALLMKGTLADLPDH